MTCQECKQAPPLTASYNCKCIKCMARWVLRHGKNARLEMIKRLTQFDKDKLKAEIVRQFKR